MKALFRIIAVIAAAYIFLGAQAHAVDVALELQLMLDTSGSVDPSEFILQKDGYEAAFRSSEVQSGIEALAPLGGIAVSLHYFSTFTDANIFDTGINIVPQIDWIQLTNAAQADAFADLIFGLQATDTDGSGKGETNIARAIQYGVEQIGTNNFEGQRRVIDISTDGVQNTLLDGTDGTNTCVPIDPHCTDIAEGERDAAQTAGITVNALAINPDDIDQEIPPQIIDDVLANLGLPSDAGIDDYLAKFVITDDGFVLPALFDDTFAAAITQKIAREISPIPLPATIWLFGSAIGFLLMKNRNRKLSYKSTRHTPGALYLD